MAHGEARRKFCWKGFDSFIFWRIVSVMVYLQDHSEVIFISHSNLGPKAKQSWMRMHWILEHLLWAPESCNLWPLYICISCDMYV